MSVRAIVSWNWCGAKPRAARRRDSATRNAATRWSADQSPASRDARPMSRLIRRNRCFCSPGRRVASTLILGNENRHSITVSSATALQG
jgi:hypothetical protein